MSNVRIKQQLLILVVNFTAPYETKFVISLTPSNAFETFQD